MTVRPWLRSLDLERYADAFEENDIDLAVAAELTAEDLRDLGVVSIGHRRRLLSAIAALAGGAAEPAPQPDGGGLAPAGPPPAESPAPAQRRQVTVLFADLVGYTTLSREVDSEELHRILQAFFERVDSIVSAHGGSVNKHIGDCVMAVFGAPVAHDNDPERAALAALAIADAMPELSIQAGQSIEVHTGLASGQAIATELGSGFHRGFEVIGDTVNRASRLADRAVAGEVLVSDDVRQTLPARVQLEQCPGEGAENVPRAARAWRLAGISGDADADDGHRSPIFGRRSELRQLEGALADCRETGEGEMVLIRGEAGIGKSRLVEALRTEAAAEGFGVHTGLVIDFGGGSRRDAIRSIVRSLLAEDGDVGGDALASAAALGLPAERTPFLHDLLGHPLPDDSRRVYEAMDNETRVAGKRETVSRLIRLIAARGPQLVIIEDLHWADRVILGHVAHLARTLADVPVVIVVTTRREGDPLGEDWRAEAGGRSMLTIDLGPLGATDAAQFARSFADRSAGFAERCIERAGGNPLFLEQLLRHGEASIEAGAVPGSIHSLVQARLDRLGEGEREAIQAASVLGQRFEQGALEALVGRSGIDLSALFSHLMLRRIDGGQILFAHALIRDAVYDSLLTSRRNALHRAAAEHFAGTDLPLRAEHLEKAGDSEAATAFLEAAVAEHQEYRYGIARRLAERGLALAETVGDRFELACLLGEICQDLGAMADAAAAWERALEAADNDPRRCRVLFGQASVKRVTDDIDGAFEDLAEAEPIAAAHGLERDLARIHHLRGNLLFPRGDHEACIGEHRRSLEIARRIGSARLEAQALGGVGDAEYARGRMRTAEELLRRCVELARETGQGKIEVANLVQLGHTGRYLHPLPQVARELASSLEACQRVGHRRAEVNGRVAAGVLNYQLQQFDAAVEHYLKAEDLIRELGAYRFLARCLFPRAQIAFRQGKRDEAPELAREAVRSTRESSFAFHGPGALAVLAEVSPDRAERRDALAEAEEVILAGSVAHNPLMFYPIAAIAAIEDGEFGEAARHADALEAFTRPEPLPSADWSIRTTRCLIAAADGRVDGGEIEDIRAEGRRTGYLVDLSDFERHLATFAGRAEASSR